jgi:hypothetical protein
VDEVELAVVDLILPDTTQREVGWRAALGRGRWRILGAAEAEIDIGYRNVARALHHAASAGLRQFCAVFRDISVSV